MIKRSTSVVVMTAASTTLLLSACEAPTNSLAQQQEMERLRAENAALRAETAAKAEARDKSFQSVEECVESGQYDQASCELGFELAKEQSKANGERFNSEAACGSSGNPCVVHHTENGSFWTPLIGGYLLGQALGGGGYEPVYVDRHGSSYYRHNGRLTYVKPQAVLKNQPLKPYRPAGNPAPKPNSKPMPPKPKAKNTTAATKGGFGYSASKSSSKGFGG